MLCKRAENIDVFTRNMQFFYVIYHFRSQMRCALLFVVVFYLSALSIVKLNRRGLFSGRSIRYFIAYIIDFMLFIA